MTYSDWVPLEESCGMCQGWFIAHAPTLHLLNVVVFIHGSWHSTSCSIHTVNLYISFSKEKSTPAKPSCLQEITPPHLKHFFLHNLGQFVHSAMGDCKNKSSSDIGMWLTLAFSVLFVQILHSLLCSDIGRRFPAMVKWASWRDHYRKFSSRFHVVLNIQFIFIWTRKGPSYVPGPWKFWLGTTGQGSMQNPRHVDSHSPSLHRNSYKWLQKVKLLQTKLMKTLTRLNCRNLIISTSELMSCTGSVYLLRELEAITRVLPIEAVSKVPNAGCLASRLLFRIMILVWWCASC